MKYRDLNSKNIVEPFHYIDASSMRVAPHVRVPVMRYIPHRINPIRLEYYSAGLQSSSPGFPGSRRHRCIIIPPSPGTCTRIDDDSTSQTLRSEYQSCRDILETELAVYSVPPERETFITENEDTAQRKPISFHINTRVCPSPTISEVTGFSRNCIEDRCQLICNRIE